MRTSLGFQRCAIRKRLVAYEYAAVSLNDQLYERSRDFRRCALSYDSVALIYRRHHKKISSALDEVAPYSDALDHLTMRVYLVLVRRANELAIRNRGVAGIGLEISSEYTLGKVISPIAGAPAAAAGIKPGDYIVAIDGRPIQGLSLDSTVAMLSGPEGSGITLTILRKGEEKPLEFTLSRTIVRVENVEYQRKDQIGYIRITSFSDNTGSLVERAVADIKRSIGSEIKGYILDLRNNHGGLLDQVVAVADNFLADGEVVTTRGRRRDDSRTYNARRGDVTDGKPIVVLINEATAAGAEIVAGALQHNRRAIIMGTRSRGHGSIQTIIPIGAPRRGELRLTTAQHYVPSGRAVEPGGIEPDIAVSQVPELSNGGSAPQYEVRLPCCFPAWSQPNQIDRAAISPDPGSAHDDFQLAQALKQLSGP